MIQQGMKEKDEIVVLSEEYRGFLTNRWSRTLVQPLLSAAQITALFVVIFIFIEVITPGREWLPFTWLIFFVAVEGYYTTLWLRRPQQVGLNHSAYRASELVLLILITRLVAWWISGDWPAWRTLGNYLRYPLQLVVDPPFWVGLVSVLIAWLRTLATSELFNRLSVSRAEVFYYSQAKNKRDSNDRPIPMRRARLVMDFFNQWVSGGIIVIFLTAASTIDIPALAMRDYTWGITRLGLRAELLLALIAYFLAGFALLSQGRLAAMNAKWLHEGVRKNPNIERSWHRYTLWLVLAIAGAALFLPLGSTSGISQIIGLLILWVSYFFTFIVSLFFALLSLLFAGGEEAQVTPEFLTPQPMPTPLATPAPTSQGAPSELFGILFSSAFWAVAIVLGVTAVAFFLRERGWKLDKRLLRQLLADLRGWLRAFRLSMGRQAEKIREAVQERLQRATSEQRGDGRPPWRFLRINDLSPRERIRYFYLSTVKRAANKGVIRQRAETPLEFTEDLKAEWPQAEDDIDALTDAFLAARYSRRLIDEKDVHPVKKRWRQMKQNLRRGKK